jgi:KDO2-lipid IV(A) lauroyltransferase
MKKFCHKFFELLSRRIAGLSLRVQMLLGGAIGVFIFDVVRLRRQIALGNIKIAFPDWSEERRVSVVRESYRNLGRGLFEFLRIPAIASCSELQGHWRGHFHIRGGEHLAAALKAGKGVFLLTAHIGSVDWAAMGMILAGHPLQIISKKAGWAALNDFWFETRKSLGAKFIDDRGSSLTILKALKKNGIIVFMLDQFMGPPIGIKTHFFGRETGTPLGLALLAGRAEAAVVPCYTCRESDGTTTVVMEAEIPFEQTGDIEETHLHMTQKYCDHIEQWVRKHPEQWMWVHRRWKKYKY